MVSVSDLIPRPPNNAFSLTWHVNLNLFSVIILSFFYFITFFNYFLKISNFIRKLIEILQYFKESLFNFEKGLEIQPTVEYKNHE